MHRRDFLKSTAAGVAGALLARGHTVRSEGVGGRRPHILFVLTDQMRCGALGCYGNRHTRTPYLDGLAAKGVRFERAYCANALCVPSRVAMATGQMPGRLGIYQNKDGRVPINATAAAHSLGVLMKQAGYATFYGGKVHMSPNLAPAVAGYDHVERDERDLLPERCLEFLCEARSSPAFAVASFLNPHDICYLHALREGQSRQVPPGLADLYRRALSLPETQLPPLPSNFAVPKDEPAGLPMNEDPDAPTPAGLMRKTFTERDWRIYRWVYARLVEQVDAQIGRLLDGLRQGGLDRTTLILVTSDHGDMEASHRLASKRFFYEESARVPLIVRPPGGPRTGRVDRSHLVSTGLDLLPTFCDYAERPRPPGLLGRSLRPLIEGHAPSDWRSFVVCEERNGRMVRTTRFKYCVYANGAIEESLFDLESDPDELRNLAGDPSQAEVLTEHRHLLREWVVATNDADGMRFIKRADRR
jgi:arylsulfatase A-like enzyme